MENIEEENGMLAACRRPTTCAPFANLLSETDAAVRARCS